MRTILLMEDDCDQRALMVELLLRHHADKVITCTSLQDAKDIIKEDEELSAIVLDLGLPDSQGSATYWEVKKQTNVTVFVLSGSTDSNAINVVKGMGDRYFIKPDSIGAAQAVAASILYASYGVTA